MNNVLSVQLISDIHLEFYMSYGTQRIRKQDNLKPIEPKADILVLAGDIGYPDNKLYKDLISDVSNKFKYVFVITAHFFCMKLYDLL